jgi:hypothetical protein
MCTAQSDLLVLKKNGRIEETFMNFMRSKGKVGGQHKFPRVLKGKILEEWLLFLKQEKVRL